MCNKTCVFTISIIKGSGKGNQELDESARKLGWMGEIKQTGLRWRRNVITYSADLMLSGSVFHRVGGD